MLPYLLPATLPITPPASVQRHHLQYILVVNYVQLPNAVLMPATAPEPIVAPIIASRHSPDAIKPATPPVNNASPATDAPPINAAASIFPAIVPTLSIGIIVPNPSVFYFCFGSF